MTFEGESDVLAIAPIKFCDDHHAELLVIMARHGVTDEMKVSHAIFSLAARTVGTDVLCQYRCPICLFQNFNFMTAMVEVFATPVAPLHPGIVLSS